VAGVGESWLDEHIGDLEQLSNPTVGLSAHPGRVDIRITAKANTDMQAEEMIWGIQATLQQRLKDRIYGVDAETLEAAVLGAVRAKGWRLVVVEAGTGGALAAALAANDTAAGAAPPQPIVSGEAGTTDAPSEAQPVRPTTFAGGRLLPPGVKIEQLAQAAASARAEPGAPVAPAVVGDRRSAPRLQVACSPSGSSPGNAATAGLPNALLGVSLALTISALTA
jgi:hypothetical protein